MKDTRHTIQLLKGCERSDNMVLVTIYTNIDYQGARRAVKWAQKKNINIKRRHRKFILKSLEFCLNHNYFWYNNIYYLQVKGITMGAKFAPRVANLYKSKWEQEGRLHNLHPRIVLYKRLIDDLLVIWKGNMNDIKIILQSMNNNYKNISLTWDISKDNIHTKYNFLDLEIYNTLRGIEAKTYFKETDS